MSMVTMVSCQLSMHILKNTDTMVMTLDTSCGMLWLSIWRRAVSYTHLDVYKRQPTTLLAWQHYNTLLSRMEAFPVKIGTVSYTHL